MDRYESFTDYAAAKHRIFMNQGPGDVAILNADDEVVSSWAKGLRAHVASFSVKRELEEGLFLRGREIVSRAPGGERVLLMSNEMRLRGLHNVENVLAAVAAGLAAALLPDSMREAIRKLSRWNIGWSLSQKLTAVKFYNDSKATSVDATVKALEAFADEAGKDSPDFGRAREKSSVRSAGFAGA